MKIGDKVTLKDGRTGVVKSYHPEQPTHPWGIKVTWRRPPTRNYPDGRVCESNYFYDDDLNVLGIDGDF